MLDIRLQGLPDGLADLPPGPRLARLLSTLDPARLNGWQLQVVLEAQNRQLAHDQARMLTVARELAHAAPCGPDDPPSRQAEANPFVGTEIAFALTWTEYAGDSLAEVATVCLDRLPDLHAAMLAGRADLPKVRLIVTELADASDEHAARVVTRLLPELHRCTTSQLRAMLRRLLLRLDPDAVRKRHTRAVADRAVTHLEFAATNTAALSASNLPIPTAAAAYNHLDALARATKVAGDPRTLDQIRADVFTDLLCGVDPTVAGTAAAPGRRSSTIHLHLDLGTLAMLNERTRRNRGLRPRAGRHRPPDRRPTRRRRRLALHHHRPGHSRRRRRARPENGSPGRRPHPPVGEPGRTTAHRPRRLPPHHRPGPLRQSPRPHLPRPRLHPPRTTLRCRSPKRLVVQPRHHYR